MKARNSIGLFASACVAAMTLAPRCTWGDRVVVVCPASLRSSLDEWVGHRERQGHEVLFVAPRVADAELRQIGRRTSERDREPLTLFLIGDGVGAGLAAPRLPAAVVSRYGPERDIATDAPYGAMLGASAVGRLPLNDALQVEAYARRVVAREREAVTWGDTRLQIAAGVGGFSPLIDATIEAAAGAVVRSLTPVETRLSLKRYPNQPADVVQVSTGERGGAWVWLGHGWRDRLPGIPSQNLIEAVDGADIAVLLACYAGDFAAAEPCVAERLLSHPSGPLAVVASTRVSMPYGNARLGAELLKRLAEPPTPPVGVLVNQARQASLTATTDPRLAGLGTLATLLGTPPDELTAERSDHAALYQLLGDPLLASRRPRSLPIDLPDTLGVDEPLTLHGQAPFDGRLIVRIGSPDAEATTPTSVLAEQACVAGDRFTVRLAKPTTWRAGARVVRVGLVGEAGLALTAKRVALRRPSTRVASVVGGGPTDQAPVAR